MREIRSATFVGFLSEHRATFSGYDLITPSPSYVGAGATRSFDHIRRIVEAAEIEEPIAWSFVYDVVVKTAPTKPMVGRTWRERKAICPTPDERRTVTSRGLAARSGLGLADA